MKASSLGRGSLLSGVAKRAPVSRLNRTGTPQRKGELTERPRQKSQRSGTCVSPAASEDSKSQTFDVSRAVVQPHFRSVPWINDDDYDEDDETTLLLLFVSESNICRSVLAEGIMRNLLKEAGLDHLIHCESRGTRDYNLGEGPDEATLEVAANLSIPVEEGFEVREFDDPKDIVRFDLVLVMDKYTAADVMREVAVYDTIQSEEQYSRKVRRLGEFHPQLKHSEEPDGQDIDDPLYGNYGGEVSRKAVEKAAAVIEASCLGLLSYLQQIEEITSSRPQHFKQAVKDDITSKECIDWLVPPMLQPRQEP